MGALRTVHAPSLALLVALTTASLAHGQRVAPPVVSSDADCEGRPMLPLDWVVVAPRPHRVGSSDTPSPTGAPRTGVETLAAAEALDGDPESLARAYALYRAASELPDALGTALYRTVRTAIRLDHYDDAMAAFARLAARPTPLPVRTTLERVMVVAVLTSPDLDGDGRRDAGFPETRLAPPFLPDAPWARALATAAVLELTAQGRADDATRARAAVLARWPDVDPSALAPPTTADTGDGTLDEATVRRAISSATLTPCTPPTPSVASVRWTVGMDGSIGAVEATPAGPTAECIRRVFEAVRVPPPEGGTVTMEGIVFFP